MDGCSNYNGLNVRKNTRSKAQARAIFEEFDIPHAKGGLFINPWTAHQFAKKHGFPLCIKPNVSGYSRGSHFPIRNYRELWKAAIMVKVWWPVSVIEQYLLGANYRVLASPDEIVSVIRRYPPFIDGDGKHSISDLIDIENALRDEMQLAPTIFPIKKSKAVIDYLAKQKLTLDSVPAKDERIYVFNRVALAPGGVVETIDQDSIPEANKELFKRVVKDLKANLFGIDIIFEEGIEKDYREQRCIFLELNSRPYIKMHLKPRYNKADDLQPFLDRMDALAIADNDIF